MQQLPQQTGALTTMATAHRLLDDQEMPLADIGALTVALEALGNQVEDPKVKGAVLVICELIQGHAERANAVREDAIHALHPHLYPARAA